MPYDAARLMYTVALGKLAADVVNGVTPGLWHDWFTSYATERGMTLSHVPLPGAPPALI
jgi:hypothetical protein